MLDCVIGDQPTTPPDAIVDRGEMSRYVQRPNLIPHLRRNAATAVTNAFAACMQRNSDRPHACMYAFRIAEIAQRQPTQRRRDGGTEIG